MQRSMNPTGLSELDRELVELADEDHLPENLDQFDFSR